VIISGISTGDNTSAMMATAENIVLLTYSAKRIVLICNCKHPVVKMRFAVCGEVGRCVHWKRYEARFGAATSSSDQIRRTFNASLSSADNRLAAAPSPTVKPAAGCLHLHVLTVCAP